MTPDDVYQQWKEQRSQVEAPNEFEQQVMSMILDTENHRHDQSSEPVPSGAMRFFEHPVVATVAVLAASVIGIARVTFALVLGIS